jgi:dienelactone hydrolase
MAHDRHFGLEAAVLAEAPGAASVHRIWPGDGVAPGSEGWDWQERTTQVPWAKREMRYTRNVVIPTVTVYRPAAGKANGTSMVIAPGGAFHFLMIDHEGHELARWLVERGVVALVLKYRLMRSPDDDAEMETFRNELQKRLGQPSQTETAPPNRPFMLDARQMGEEDGRQAIRFARAHAAEWGIDPHKIGIAGFSAGGGVAMGAAMSHDAYTRPDYAVGVYPAYRAELGIPASPPPLFLIISDDDKSVAPISSSRLYEDWHKAGAPAELHVFGDGAHGWGMNKDGFTSDIWPVLLENWMRLRGLL